MLRLGPRRLFKPLLLPSSSVAPGRSLLLSRRPYFSSPCLAATHKSRPKSRVAVPRKSIPPALPPSSVSTEPKHPLSSQPTELHEDDLRTPAASSSVSTEPGHHPASQPAELDLRTPNSVRNQILFAGFVVFDVFLWAATRTNTEIDQLVDKLAPDGDINALDNRTLGQARAEEIIPTLVKWGALISRMTQNLPEIPRTVLNESYLNAAKKYAEAPGVTKVCWGICAFNTAIFVAWRIPRLTGFMARNFVHRPLSGLSRTLLTSVFSHEAFFHLLFNSMALLSFGAASGYYFDKQARSSPHLESTAAYHFFAFFVTAGLFSSLASHFLRLRLYNLAVSRLTTLGQSGFRPYIGGSLGASGAIYSAVVISALAFPEAHVSPIFIPISIPIQVGVGGMALLDVVGFLRGWRMFDHIAHLGGAVFGVWYYLYGPRLWDSWKAFAGSLFDDKPRKVRRVD
ncbi:hypothetical protein B0H15DRAFT_835549 [Mycena belliarum]|uniref:Peptidase S54 rhomboid domain-containing protein n=1 Tax=Mycena belliarum TaxID=1033014 RepID=A0AAD6UAT8_9AGAR|nr:hypothetical protein B0H15DRAFT_835549 [Mycena belliae]